nr:DNA polymerase epsilon subunit 3 [Ipomoea trifida]GMD22936.1 DNA polymerase epsilon subunit 3 [Ipomoea batatas]GMD56078.1 DNA polymerase epsilon subunit 3 [Ipomoea batatas]
MADEKEKGAAMPEVEVEDLPKTIVRRLVKDKLSQLSKDGEMSLLREAHQAFSESARIFIHYLSAAANDVCMESKRQTMNAEDVFKALDEIEFSEFTDPLRASLEEFRQKHSKRKAAASKSVESNKKAKNEETPAENGTSKKKQESTDNKKGKNTKPAVKENGARKAQPVESEEKDGEETNESEEDDVQEGNESGAEDGQEGNGSESEDEQEGNGSEAENGQEENGSEAEVGIEGKDSEEEDGQEDDESEDTADD